MTTFNHKILMNMERSYNVINKKNVNPTAKDIEDVVADKIFQTIPKDTILHFNKAVDYVNRQTGIPTDLVSKGLVKAVSRKKFVTDSTGAYIRKNQL